MKDISTVFACEAEKKEKDEEALRVAAVKAALRCCIESTSDEWLKDGDDLRLPLQPGVWFAFDSGFSFNYEYDQGLYLERVKKNRKGKSRGVQRSYSQMGSASALAQQLRSWGITP